MQLRRYKLEFDKAFPFFIERIDCGTPVSKKIIQQINFKKGSFITHLPESVDFEKIYDLKCGGILPENEKRLSAKSGSIPENYSFLSEHISRFLSGFKERIVFLGHICFNQETSKLELEGTDLSFCNDHINYFMRDGISLMQIEAALQRTQEDYPLIIFLEDAADFPKNLKDEDVERICKEASLIAITAYNGESFIFWEKDKVFKNVSKHELDFDKTFPYFVKHINWETRLSEKLVKKINFKEGHFFTFLPDCADLSKINDLKYGGILPQYKAVKFPGKSGIFVPVPDVDPAICDYIQQFLDGDNNRIVFFEDFNARLKDPKLEIDGAALCVYDINIYYFIKDGISLEQIDYVISRTQPAWQSIMIFLDQMEDLPKNLLEEDLERICAHATHIATTAYDGESFVFWEKNEK